MSSWFQLTPIPANAIHGYYNLWLVTLSYVIAVLASYVALDIVGRLRAESNNKAKTYWLVGGAFTMGAGIWSMHFIGMLAFIMPMPMGYKWSWTFASLVVAMLASALALFILRNKEYSNSHLIIGGILIGFGIATMHYMGMQGMTGYINIHYLPGLFTLSIIIAIGAAEAALWLALHSNQGSSKRQFYLKIISALIMGVAICGMHYMGMAAAVFTPNSLAPMHPDQTSIPPEYLAIFIAGITGLIISLALTVSIYYKQMVNAIQNEKEFLNAILNNLDDGIVACDAAGMITVLNKSLEKNINAKKITGSINNLLDYFDLYTMDNVKVASKDMPMGRALHGERIRQLELIAKFKNNQDKDIIIDGQQIVDAEGRILGAVAIIHDVTELKKTEKIKKEFVSIVSHELRTPLTSIRGSMGLLVSGAMGEFPDKAKKLLEIANNNCERLLLLINDILDIEKIEAGKMDFKLKKISLTQTIQNTISANEMYARKFDVSLKMIDEIPNICVIADEERLMQVLANLISNACKFSPPQGHVTIAVKQLNDNVRVSVSDEGAGIPVEFQPYLFQKFSQADTSTARVKGGTGLGLSISKTIIEKMGGDLNFITRPDKGTTFYFELPILLECEETEETVVRVQTENKKRLLICEDDQDQAEYLSVFLETAGYLTDQAHTVAQAKNLLGKREYYALLLDLILPDQDGISLIRELRNSEETSNLPIIVISIIAQTGRSLLTGEAISLIDWLEKPIDFNKLLASINRIKKTIPDRLPHILHIEDDVDTQHVIGELLKNYATITTAGSLQQSKEMLAKESYDLVILDLLLPDGNGIEIIPLLAEHKFPILVFSAVELDQEYAKYVSLALTKAKSSNEDLLTTIINLLK